MLKDKVVVVISFLNNSLTLLVKVLTSTVSSKALIDQRKSQESMYLNPNYSFLAAWAGQWPLALGRSSSLKRIIGSEIQALFLCSLLYSRL